VSTEILISLLEKDALGLPVNQIQPLLSRLERLQRALAGRLVTEKCKRQSDTDERWLEAQAEMIAFEKEERADGEPTWESLIEVEQLNPFGWQ
jgi:hypothetical protein